MRRKGVDVVLAIALAAAALYGASVLGHAVTKESNEGIAGDPSPAQTTPAASADSGNHDLQIRVALFAVAGIVGIAIVLSAISAFIRRPRHRPPVQPISRRRR